MTDRFDPMTTELTMIGARPRSHMLGYHPN